MSNKIVTSFLNTPLTLLLILLIVLIIFCIMQHKIYNLQSIMFDNEDNEYNNMNYKNNNSIKINENIIILNKMIEESKSKLKLKEKFDPLTQQDLSIEMNNLLDISSIIDNFNTTSLPMIQNVIDTINSQRITNKNEILRILNNIYTLRYIDMVNQQNAVAYHEYNKYISPKQNIFYKQYL